jgi:archaellin
VTGTNLAGTSVGVVNMTLKKSPGASNIDLENVTVQWVGPSGTYNLVNATVDASGADWARRQRAVASIRRRGVRRRGRPPRRR